MKKNINKLAIMAGIMTTIFCGVIVGINKNHKAELAEMEQNYQKQIEAMEYLYSNIEFDYNELEHEMEELETAVWKMINDEEYFFVLEHEDEYYLCEGVKYGWILKEDYVIMTTN